MGLCFVTCGSASDDGFVVVFVYHTNSNSSKNTATSKRSVAVGLEIFWKLTDNE